MDVEVGATGGDGEGVLLVLPYSNKGHSPHQSLIKYRYGNGLEYIVNMVSCD